MHLSWLQMVTTCAIFGSETFYTATALTQRGIPGILTYVDPTDWLHECVPEFTKNVILGSNSIDSSNYVLIDKPSGLCADFLGCAFTRCNITLANIEYFFKYPNLQNLKFKDVEKNLPAMNLPEYVSFPENVKDVKDAVLYASRECKTVSIKNGGHSYQGASSQSGSVQLNLRKFPKYSQSSIVECNSESADNACKLALARGKKATVRVGGGELWNDLYQAVMNYPGNGQEPKYDVVGGGAGSVSAIGGWMQGGGESIGDERMYGFGVDQVLELEMILADGSHIKFGPTNWQVDSGFLYPKTTKVEGFCNDNVSENEAEWNWKPCTSYPFAKLWKAVRGGGGGTYGVVTAATYQIHDHRSMSVIVPNTDAGARIKSKCETDGTCDKIKREAAFFFVDLLFNPQAIGVDEETSISTGHPGFNFNIESFSSLFSRSPAKVLAAWKEYVKTLDGWDEIQSDLQGLFFDVTVTSYAKMLLNVNDPRVPAGKIPDNPPPGWGSDTSFCWSVLVPKQALLNKNDFLYDLLMHFGHSPHVIGGKTSISHDQMTSINPIQRSAGLQACIYDESMESLARQNFYNFYNSSNPSKQYPGGTEYNHISNVKFGPLKSDITKACPSNLSFENQKSQCISLEESVWGTELLAELESIKKEVDPNNIFKCFRCVGYDNEGCTKTAPGPETSATLDQSLYASLLALWVLWGTAIMLYTVF